MVDKKAFIEKFGPMAAKSVAGTPLFASVALAQAALETGWANSKPYNNMFGMKAQQGYKGSVYSATTQEVINGKRQTFKGIGKKYASREAALNDGANKYTIFKVYDTLQDSWNDRVRMLMNRKGYAAALKAKTPEEQIAAIKAGGYATGTNYVDTITSIINTNGLKRFDQQAEVEKKN